MEATRGLSQASSSLNVPVAAPPFHNKVVKAAEKALGNNGGAVNWLTSCIWGKGKAPAVQEIIRESATNRQHLIRRLARESVERSHLVKLEEALDADLNEAIAATGLNRRHKEKHEALEASAKSVYNQGFVAAVATHIKKEMNEAQLQELLELRETVKNDPKKINWKQFAGLEGATKTETLNKIDVEYKKRFDLVISKAKELIGEEKRVFDVYLAEKAPGITPFTKMQVLFSAVEKLRVEKASCPTVNRMQRRLQRERKEIQREHVNALMSQYQGNEQIVTFLRKYNEAIEELHAKHEIDILGSLKAAIVDLIKGRDATENLVAAIQGITIKADQNILDEIAATLVDGGEAGVENVVNKYILNSDEDGAEAIPYNLKRILSYLVSEEGRRSLNNVAAKRMFEEILGPDNEFSQELFNQGMNNLVEKYLLPAKKEEAAEPADQPAANKTKMNELIDAVMKWAVEGNGLPKLGVLLLQHYAVGIHGDCVSKTREELQAQKRELDQKIGEGGQNLAANITELITKTIKEEIQQPEADEERVEGEPVDGEPVKGKTIEVDLTEFGVKRVKGQEKGPLIYFYRQERVAIGMEEEDFKLMLEVAIKQAILKGDGLLNDAAGDQNGFDFLCTLTGDSLEVMQQHMVNPAQKVKWDDEKKTLELATKLFGQDGSELGLSPFIGKLLMGIMAPNAVGSLPFKVLGAKAIGPRILENLYSGSLYKKAFDDLLGEIIDNELEGIQSQGNIYDLFMSPSSERPELSPEEERLKGEIGKLAFRLFRRHHEDWANKMEDSAFDWRETFEERIGEFMVVKLREYLKRETGKKEVEDITVSDLYDFLLKKGAESVQEMIDGGEPANNQDKAVMALGQLEAFVEPLNEHKSIIGLIFGAIGYFIRKITIEPICRLISHLVKEDCEKHGKDYEATFWYKWIERPKVNAAKREGEKIYTPLIEQIQSEEMWKEIWSSMLDSTFLRKAEEPIIIQE